MVDERDDSFLRAVAYVAPVEPEPLERTRLGTVLAGKYLLEEAIGHGGMAHVFAARHQVTGKRVAVKWMRPQSYGDDKGARRFVREARAIGSIDHPNVVSVYDAGTHDGSPFLVMELLQGQTLRARLRAGPPLAPDEAVGIALQIIAGVQAAHRRGILHRDIKPDNVFLCDRPGEAPLPKVLDFGVSSVAREHGDLSTLTDHGTIVGTPGYMPLEQLQAIEELDLRVDVYAVGVVLYEMLTGQRPFPARTYAELIVQLAMSEAQRPERLRPGIDIELSSIVMKAIARERGDRYPDLESMARALADYPRRPAVLRFLLRYRRPALLIATGALLAAGVHVWLEHDGGAHVPDPTPEQAAVADAPLPAAPAAQPAIPPQAAPQGGAPPAPAPPAAVLRVAPGRPRRSSALANRPQQRPLPAAEPDRATTLRRTDF